jgi:hypothetical protein
MRVPILPKTAVSGKWWDCLEQVIRKVFLLYRTGLQCHEAGEIFSIRDSLR